jgi:hypothetical protein
MRRPVRQWIVFVALAGGLAAAAVGEQRGMPNSWAWFGSGAVLAVVVALMLAAAHRRRIRRQRPRPESARYIP